jgi:branched-chain amino acid transport system ATP-binding protein
MSQLLHTKGLRKSFGAVTAADDVSITITSNERVSLIGSNGAGKTTFANMVTGYLKPDAGSIEFLGKDISKLSPREVTKQGIARSFQIPQVFLQLSVLDNMLVAIACSQSELSFTRSSHRAEAIDSATRLLERFALHAYCDRKVVEMPGGMRKLLDIAMALTATPKLLLLDEPTSGVSVDEKFPMMDTVSAALESEGVSVLFVEHDMEIVQRYSKRVIAFYSGRVIADASPADVLADEQVQLYVTGRRK